METNVYSWIFNKDWLVCIYIPASAGPIGSAYDSHKAADSQGDSVNCLGVERMITLMAPTLVSDKPVVELQD